MNFGAILQSYATYTFLESHGYSPVLIDYNEETPLRLKLYIHAILSKFFGIWEFKLFFKKYFKNRTIKCKTKGDLEKLNEELDVFVVGSDQVWRYLWLKTRVLHYFLDFVDDGAKKIAYAASFGIDKWNEAPSNITEEIRILINRFHSISVREYSGVTICKDIFDVDALQVLDPSLLLDSPDYDKIIEKEYMLNSNAFIAKMILDENIENDIYIKKMALKLSLSIINIKGKRISLFGKVFYKLNSIGKWLSFIKKADLVITDSFHCVVFSIIYRKSFICLGNKTRGLARIESLLKLFNLEKRLCLVSNNDLNDVMEYDIINYDNVYSILNRERLKSTRFLLNSLQE